MVTANNKRWHRFGILALGVVAAGDGYWHKFGILTLGWLWC